MRRAAIWVISLLLALATQTHAQTKHTLAAPSEGASPRATLNDVQWLVGSWEGTGLGGNCNEIWSAPAGGAMMGVFRLVTEGAVEFYEFMTLREEEGSLVMKLKHFGGDLTPWEERERWVTFRLARLAATEAYFGGLTYRLVDKDTLRVFVALHDAKGETKEAEFVFRRQPTLSAKAGTAAPGATRRATR